MLLVPRPCSVICESVRGSGDVQPEGREGLSYGIRKAIRWKKLEDVSSESNEGQQEGVTDSHLQMSLKDSQIKAIPDWPTDTSNNR